MATNNRTRNHFDDFENNSQSEPKNMNNNGLTKLIVSGILLLVALVVVIWTFEVVTIEGNQLGIKETWGGGVDKTIMQPKTYFLFPGWSQKVYKYDASSQVFVMNDKAGKQGEKGVGREADAYLVQSQEGQDMKISLNLRWRIDPAKLVMIHTTVREDIEEKIIRPVVMRVVKDKATKMKAIDAYSGEGLVKLQSDIQDALSGKDKNETDELAERGVTVENFVIEHIELDPNYIAEIKKKQIATQQQLRAVEEEKAATAEALVAKAKAQADLNTKVVGAERDAKIMVVGAQAENEKVIIAAKAAAEQVTINAKAQAEQVRIAAEAQKEQLALQGEGEKLKMIAEAEGTLAKGKAEASAKQLMLDAYKAAGPEAFVKVEIAKAMADGTKGIQGYLPNNFNPTVISGNFMDAIQNILKVIPVPQATPQATPVAPAVK